MREIKYKAYHKPTKKMFNVYSLSKDFIFEDTLDGVGVKHTIPAERNDCILLQFTGLKDINGADIYEGDILDFKKENQFSDTPVIVKFSAGSFVVYNPDCCEICKNSFGCIAPIGECLAISNCAEIIGNIHEKQII